MMGALRASFTAMIFPFFAAAAKNRVGLSVRELQSDVTFAVTFVIGTSGGLTFLFAQHVLTGTSMEHPEWFGVSVYAVTFVLLKFAYKGLVDWDRLEAKLLVVTPAQVNFSIIMVFIGFLGVPLLMAAWVVVAVLTSQWIGLGKLIFPEVPLNHLHRKSYSLLAGAAAIVPVAVATTGYGLVRLTQELME